MNSDFWRHKRVFLTGHTGFKGSWLSIWLQQLGADVIGFSLKPHPGPNLFDLANVVEGIESNYGNVLDYNDLELKLTSSAPDIVIHMAAQAIVRSSYVKPVETFATNIMGTAHLLEAVRTCPSVRVVLVVTSDKCYKNNEWVWAYREDEPLGGVDPYSSSKAAAELVTNAFRASFFQKSHVAVATVRAGNVVGGGDWAEDRLIPDVIRAFSEGRKVLIRRPTAIRPWQHVLEPLGGYLRLAECMFYKGERFAGAWNFGPDEREVRTVEWVVNSLASHLDGAIAVELEMQEQPHEANALRVDISKARNELGWAPVWGVEDALLLTAEWYKNYFDGGDIRFHTLEQIDRYRREL